VGKLWETILLEQNNVFRHLAGEIHEQLHIQ
jgi:hypothetical protein